MGSLLAYILLQHNINPLSVCHLSFLSVSGVVIGFESTEYTVEASSGEALVGVSILSGQLSRSLTVTLQTADDSAVGKPSHLPSLQPVNTTG